MKTILDISKLVMIISISTLFSYPVVDVAGHASVRTTDDIPCPPMPVVNPARMALIVEPKPHIGKIEPATRTDQINYANWLKIDPYGLCRYREENRLLPHPGHRRVVFIGDSITESWKPSVPSFFTEDVIDRGISGQTTVQMLARFRQDVIDLRPAIVHIMGGINDISSPSGMALTRSNVQSMVELAQANGITVILGEITPCSFFEGAPDRAPGPQIVRFNRWLEDYARKRDLIIVKYHAKLADGNNGIRVGLSNDGLHPNRLGFKLITPMVHAAIASALRMRADPAPR